jgi:hypothetical protein
MLDGSPQRSLPFLKGRGSRMGCVGKGWCAQACRHIFHSPVECLTHFNHTLPLLEASTPDGKSSSRHKKADIAGGSCVSNSFGRWPVVISAGGRGWRGQMLDVGGPCIGAFGMTGDHVSHSEGLLWGETDRPCSTTLPNCCAILSDWIKSSLGHALHIFFRGFLMPMI